MATKYDMPTNEGSLALARSISTGAKLAIRGAALCNYSGDKMSSVSKVASLTWADISSSAVEGGIMSCMSYLPSMVDYQGLDTTKPIAALDLEFSYLPTEEIHYNTIAVLADLYYPIAPFKAGASYDIGTVVLYNDGNSETYYRCKEKVTNSTVPAYDLEHWNQVNVVSTMDSRGVQYSTITDIPVLLYVSKIPGIVTVSPQMELAYKVRLYLEGVQDSANIKDFVVFDKLGLEIFSSTELNFIAEFANQLKRVRDVAMVKASRS